MTSNELKSQTINVGIDMSVSSPGLCIQKEFHGSEATNKFFYEFSCFAQRNKDQDIEKKHGNVNLTVFERIPNSKDSYDLNRYKHVINNFMNFLEKHDVDHNTNIYIENYAFVHPSMAGNSYKLHEITGILKYLIFQKFDIIANMIPVSSWKKSICGNGHSTKNEVVKRVREIVEVDFMKIFGYKIDESDTQQTIKNPVQDICDSFCICVNAQKSFQKIILKKPPKKRQKN